MFQEHLVLVLDASILASPIGTREGNFDDIQDIWQWNVEKNNFKYGI
jgi:hypothetical protein